MKINLQTKSPSQLQITISTFTISPISILLDVILTTILFLSRLNFFSNGEENERKKREPKTWYHQTKLKKRWLRGKTQKSQNKDELVILLFIKKKYSDFEHTIFYIWRTSVIRLNINFRFHWFESSILDQMIQNNSKCFTIILSLFI